MRTLLQQIRRSERSDQKRLRYELRAIGFYIDDWPRAASGFTASDFDDLLAQGLIRVCDR